MVKQIMNYDATKTQQAILSYTPTPSLKTIKSVLSLMKEIQLPTVPEAKGITRGPEYYRKKKYTKTVVQKTVQIAQ